MVARLFALIECFALVSVAIGFIPLPSNPSQRHGRQYPTYFGKDNIKNDKVSVPLQILASSIASSSRDDGSRFSFDEMSGLIAQLENVESSAREFSLCFCFDPKSMSRSSFMSSLKRRCHGLRSRLL